MVGCQQPVDVFVSYTDRGGYNLKGQMANNLYNHLTSNGLSTFLDFRVFGEAIYSETKMLQEIANCHVGIVLVDEAFLTAIYQQTSWWCLVELRTLYARHKRLLNEKGTGMLILVGVGTSLERLMQNTEPLPTVTDASLNQRLGNLSQQFYSRVDRTELNDPDLSLTRIIQSAQLLEHTGVLREDELCEKLFEKSRNTVLASLPSPMAISWKIFTEMSQISSVFKTISYRFFSPSFAVLVSSADDLAGGLAQNIDNHLNEKGYHVFCANQGTDWSNVIPPAVHTHIHIMLVNEAFVSCIYEGDTNLNLQLRFLLARHRHRTSCGQQQRGTLVVVTVQLTRSEIIQSAQRLLPPIPPDILIDILGNQQFISVIDTAVLLDTTLTLSSILKEIQCFQLTNRGEGQLVFHREDQLCQHMCDMTKKVIEPLYQNWKRKFLDTYDQSAASIRQFLIWLLLGQQSLLIVGFIFMLVVAVNSVCRYISKQNLLQNLPFFDGWSTSTVTEVPSFDLDFNIPLYFISVEFILCYFYFPWWTSGLIKWRPIVNRNHPPFSYLNTFYSFGFHLLGFHFFDADNLECSSVVSWLELCWFFGVQCFLSFGVFFLMTLWSPFWCLPILPCICFSTWGWITCVIRFPFHLHRYLINLLVITTLVMTATYIWMLYPTYLMLWMVVFQLSWICFQTCSEFLWKSGTYHSVGVSVLICGFIYHLFLFPVRSLPSIAVQFISFESYCFVAFWFHLQEKRPWSGFVWSLFLLSEMMVWLECFTSWSNLSYSAVFPRVYLVVILMTQFHSSDQPPTAFPARSIGNLYHTIRCTRLTNNDPLARSTPRSVTLFRSHLIKSFNYDIVGLQFLMWKIVLGQINIPTTGLTRGQKGFYYYSALTNYFDVDF
eukprot:Lithocolla_globosa_v1_NODE_509_length_3874_cov_19.439906.p1 type:complete len:886 gc:universal NODE_509_length_3874_cov_19.439906:3367-710(-)